MISEALCEVICWLIYEWNMIMMNIFTLDMKICKNSLMFYEIWILEPDKSASRSILARLSEIFYVHILSLHFHGDSFSSS